MTIMHEIVGESGSAGEGGCLIDVAVAGVAVLMLAAGLGSLLLWLAS